MYCAVSSVFHRQERIFFQPTSTAHTHIKDPVFVYLHQRGKTRRMRRSLFLASSRMFVLGERDVRRALTWDDCLEVNRKAYKALAIGKAAYVPSRLGVTYPNHPHEMQSSIAEAQDWTLIKPAAFYGNGSSHGHAREKDGGGLCNHDMAIGLKLVSVRANNPSLGLPLVPATISLVDPASGMVNATISGTHLTVARTSAGPALAVQTFKPKAEHLVVFGAGAQAECHIQLMQWAVGHPHTPSSSSLAEDPHTIKKITIVNRSWDRAEKLQRSLQEEFAQQGKTCTVSVILLDDLSAKKQALQSADVIATTTNSSSPLWSDEDDIHLQPGCLITSIGSYTPNMIEIPNSVVNRSYVLVDTADAVNVGDLKHLGVDPSQLNVASSRKDTEHKPTHPMKLFGTALANPACVALAHPDNSDSGNRIDCIFYKAVGTAIQDVLTARLVVKRAKSLGMGQEVDMT